MILTDKVEDFLKKDPSDIEIYTQVVLGNFNVEDLKCLLAWNEVNHKLNRFTHQNISEIYQSKIENMKRHDKD